MENRFRLILKDCLGFSHHSAQCLSLLPKGYYHLPMVYIALQSLYLSILAYLIQRAEEMQCNA